MPITGRKGGTEELLQKQRMSAAEQRELAALISEAKMRGLPLPKEAQIRNPFGNWGVGPNGYFIKSTGIEYVPNEKQEAFIHSTAARVAIFGGRGCLSADTKVNGVSVGDMAGNHTSLYSLKGIISTGGFFKKGREHLYSVRTQLGGEVEATLFHRILTPVGYRQIVSLSSGDLVLSDGIQHGEPEKQIQTGLMDHYSQGFRLSDELHALVVETSLNIWQQLHRIGDESSAWEQVYFLSTVDFLSRMLYQFFSQYLVQPECLESILNQLHTVVQSLCNLNHSDIQQRFFESLSLSEREGIYDLFQPLLHIGNIYTEVYQQRLYISELHKQYFGVVLSLQSSVLSRDLQQIYPQVSYEVLGYSASRIQIFWQFSERLIEKYRILLQQYLNCEFLKLAGISDSIWDVAERSREVLSPSLGKFFGQWLPSSQVVLPLQVYSRFQEFLQQLSHNLHFLDDLSIYPFTPSSNDYTLYCTALREIKYSKVGDYYDVTVPEVENYFAGGMIHHNSGKTAAGAQKALLKIREGKTGLVLNADFENLRTSTWPELRQWIPWDMVVPAHRYRSDESWEAVKPFALAFMNGAKMYVKGLKDPESARGPNVNWLWYDEAGRDKTGMGWKIATGGVRIGDDAQAFATTTPKGTLHWMYKFFVQKEFTDEVKEMIEQFAKDRPFIEYFHITIEENKHNLSPDFYASMLATYPSGWLRQQELEGQFANEEGSLGHREWFDGHFLPRPPIDVKVRVRYWDLAGTAKKVVGKKFNDPDFTVGTLLSLTHDGKFVIEDQTSGQWVWGDIKKNIIATALLDGPTVPIYIELEPGAGGKNQIAEFQTLIELTGFTVREHKPVGDKVQRANPWFSRAEAGMVWMVMGEWNSKFLNELDNFPTDGTHDDTVDSVSGAFNTLSPFKPWTRIRFLHLGMSAEQIEKAEKEDNIEQSV